MLCDIAETHTKIGISREAAANSRAELTSNWRLASHFYKCFMRKNIKVSSCLCHITGIVNRTIWRVTQDVIQSASEMCFRGAVTIIFLFRFGPIVNIHCIAAGDIM